MRAPAPPKPCSGTGEADAPGLEGEEGRDPLSSCSAPDPVMTLSHQGVMRRGLWLNRFARRCS